MMNRTPFSDDSLDQWLKSQAEQSSGALEPDGWDTPSPQVWVQVRASIDARKKKKRFVWWWFPGILAFGILVSLANGQMRLLKTPETGKNIREIQEKTTPEKNSTSIDSNTPNRQTPQQTGFATNTEPALVFSAQTMRAAGMERATPVTAPLEKPLQTQVFSPETPDVATLNSPSPFKLLFAVKPLGFLPFPPLKPFEQVSNHRTKQPVPIKKYRPKPYYFGTGAATFFTYRIIKDRAGITQASGGPARGGWTRQSYLMVGRVLNRHWALESGLQYSAVRLTSQHKATIRFRADQEQYDVENEEYVSRFEQTLQSTFGAADLRFDLTRNPDQSIPDKTKIKVKLQTDERVTYLRMPLSALFTVGRNRWSASASAGLGMNVQVGYQMHVDSASADLVTLKNLSTQSAKRAAGMAGFYTDIHTGLALGYHLFSQWTVQAGAEYRYGFQPMYNNGTYFSYPVSLGIRLGVLWRPALR
jgi:hypothetical protein